MFTCLPFIRNIIIFKILKTWPFIMKKDVLNYYIDKNGWDVEVKSGIEVDYFLALVQIVAIFILLWIAG